VAWLLPTWIFLYRVTRIIAETLSYWCGSHLPTAFRCLYCCQTSARVCLYVYSSVTLCCVYCTASTYFIYFVIIYKKICVLVKFTCNQTKAQKHIIYKWLCVLTLIRSSLQMSHLLTNELANQLLWKKHREFKNIVRENFGPMNFIRNFTAQNSHCN